MIWDIELTNHCNKSCGICPRSSLTRKRGYMSDRTFDSVIAALASDTMPQVFFTGFGEPTLHSRFVEYTRRIKSAGFRLTVTTNGETTSEASDFIHCDQVYVSMHYPKDEVLKKFAGMKHKVTVTAVSSLITNPLAVKDICNQHGFVFQETKCHSRGGNTPDSVCDTSTEDMRGKRCRVFSTINFVAWNGDVLPCCHDMHGDVIGSLEKLPDRNVAVDYLMCAKCSDSYR